LFRFRPEDVLDITGWAFWRSFAGPRSTIRGAWSSARFATPTVGPSVAADKGRLNRTSGRRAALSGECPRDGCDCVMTG